jgi:excisionase family DNA binding protein
MQMGVQLTTTAHSAQRRRPPLTIDDVAETMNLQPKTIRTWVSRREIPFVRVGHSIRFRPEVIDELIANGEVRARQRRRRTDARTLVPAD